MKYDFADEFKGYQAFSRVRPAVGVVQAVTNRSASCASMDGTQSKVTVPSDATPLYSLGVEFFSDGSNANTAYIDSVDW